MSSTLQYTLSILVGLAVSLTLLVSEYNLFLVVFMGSIIFLALNNAPKDFLVGLTIGGAIYLTLAHGIVIYVAVALILGVAYIWLSSIGVFIYLGLAYGGKTSTPRVTIR